MQSQWPTLALYWYAPQDSRRPSPIPSSAVLSASISLRCPPGSSSPDGCSRWPCWLPFLPCSFWLRLAAGARWRAAFRLRLPCLGAAFPLLPDFCCSRLRFASISAASSCSLSRTPSSTGVTYTDAHVTLIGMLFISVALAMGAVIVFAGSRAQPARPLADRLRSLPRPSVLSWPAIAGWYVSNFIVKPNQLDRERPYIADNIAMTRQAYGLDRFAQQRVPRGNHRRRCRSGEQPGHARKHPPVGRGMRSRTRCARCRRFAPITIFPASTSTAIRSTARCARSCLRSAS